MQNNEGMIDRWKQTLSAADAAVADSPAGFVELEDWDAWTVTGGSITSTCSCCYGTCGTCCGSQVSCTCGCKMS